MVHLDPFSIAVSGNYENEVTIQHGTHRFWNLNGSHWIAQLDGENDWTWFSSPPEAWMKDLLHQNFLLSQLTEKTKQLFSSSLWHERIADELLVDTTHNRGAAHLSHQLSPKIRSSWSIESWNSQFPWFPWWSWTSPVHNCHRNHSESPWNGSGSNLGALTIEWLILTSTCSY